MDSTILGIIVGASAATVPGLVKVVVDFFMQRSKQNHELQIKRIELEYETKKAAFQELVESMSGICFSPVQASDVAYFIKQSQRARVFLPEAAIHELDQVIAIVNSFSSFGDPGVIACGDTDRLERILREDLRATWRPLKKKPK